MDYQNYSSSPETDIFQKSAVVYGGFWERFFAYLIDVILLWIVNFGVQYAVGDIPGSIISIVINWLYFAIMESGTGQATIGKKALGLKVTDLNGGQITFGQATGRYFGKILSTLIILIGFLMMLWDERKQTLHDKMAGTLVVKATQDVV